MNDRDSAVRIDPEAAKILRMVVGPLFAGLEQDIFQRGFGQPLSDEEQAKFNAALDEILKRCRDAIGSEGFAPSDGPPIFQLAVNGHRGLNGFLQVRETRVADCAGGARLRGPNDSTQAFRREIVENLRTAEREEVRALGSTQRSGGRSRKSLMPVIHSGCLAILVSEASSASIMASDLCQQ